MPKTRLWLLLTVPAVLLVFAAGWFLVVSPKQAAADAVRSSTSDVEQNVAITKARLAQLRRMAADLPAQQDALDKLEKKVPDGPQLPALQRALATSAKQSDVTLVTTAPGAPVVFSAAGTGTSAPSATATQKPSASGSGTTADTVYTVPVSIVVTGEYGGMQAFVAKLEQLQRALLVQGFDLEHVPSESADTATPGSLKLTVTGQVFVSSAEAATISTSSTAAAGQVSPGPVQSGAAK